LVTAATCPRCPEEFACILPNSRTLALSLVTKLSALSRPRLHVGGAGAGAEDTDELLSSLLSSEDEGLRAFCAVRGRLQFGAAPRTPGGGSPAGGTHCCAARNSLIHTSLAACAGELYV